jgi:hypothetical protein
MMKLTYLGFGGGEKFVTKEKNFVRLGAEDPAVAVIARYSIPCHIKKLRARGVTIERPRSK